MDGLDGSDLEDNSENDFEGYLDMDMNDIEEERDEREVLDIEQSVGEEVEVASGSADTVPEYALEAGCTASQEGESLLDFFSLLLTDSILEDIVVQTNLSAQQFIDMMNLHHTHVSGVGRSPYMIQTNSAAMIIIMGLVRYQQIEHHWATQWPYSNTHFSSVS